MLGSFKAWNKDNGKKISSDLGKGISQQKNFVFKAANVVIFIMNITKILCLWWSLTCILHICTYMNISTDSQSVYWCRFSIDNLSKKYFFLPKNRLIKLIINFRSIEIDFCSLNRKMGTTNGIFSVSWLQGGLSNLICLWKFQRKTWILK